MFDINSINKRTCTQSTDTHKHIDYIIIILHRLDKILLSDIIILLLVIIIIIYLKVLYIQMNIFCHLL